MRPTHVHTCRVKWLLLSVYLSVCDRNTNNPAGISEPLNNFYTWQKHIAVVDFSVCVFVRLNSPVCQRTRTKISDPAENVHHTVLTARCMCSLYTSTYKFCMHVECSRESSEEGLHAHREHLATLGETVQGIKERTASRHIYSWALLHQVCLYSYSAVFIMSFVKNVYVSLSLWTGGV